MPVPPYMFLNYIAVLVGMHMDTLTLVSNEGVYAHIYLHEPETTLLSRDLMIESSPVWSINFGFAL